jgi:hypothetical protein
MTQPRAQFDPRLTDLFDDMDVQVVRAGGTQRPIPIGGISDDTCTCTCISCDGSCTCTCIACEEELGTIRPGGGGVIVRPGGFVNPGF